LSLGVLDLPAEQYKELASCIEAMLRGQKQLFSQDPDIEKPHSIFTVGYSHMIGKFGRNIGFPPIFLANLG